EDEEEEDAGGGGPSVRRRRRGVPSPPPCRPPPGVGAEAANGIADLGGAALDLAGGAYLISAPLVVPGHVGNLHLRQGTLRASPRFPSDRWLLTIGDPGCVSAARGSDESSEAAYCNQFVSVVDMLFDAAHVAAGGVHVANTMGRSGMLDAPTIQTFLLVGRVREPVPESALGRVESQMRR
ncbi:unnamed protein product, partial [Prorocentrum cordatum]